MAKRLGALIDCSRNCVYTVDALKKFIDILADIGYDYLQLYTEDTFDIGDPRFGYLRGRYNVAEIKELDGYASARGIELIPFIQTLGHLKGVTRWWAYSDICDTGNILLAGEEKTYALIDKMFAACAEMYTSRNINIGMDEAGMVGLGKYLSKHGYRNRYDVLLEHLRNVCDIAKKYGFKPMMWSDMFFRLANDGSYKVSDGFVVPKEIIDKVPPEVRLIYWDYYSKDKATYDAQFKAHKQFRNEILFAGGAWCWNGFAPHNNWSVRINKEAFISCNDNGINDICITEWKDDGGESSLFGVLPALFASAQFFRGNYDMMDIKCKFGKKFGIDYDDFTALDLPDMLDGDGMENPSKYMLYSDPFLGYMDSTVDEGKARFFAEAKTKIDKSVSNKEYGYIFQTISALCDVLDIKYDLGVRTRGAYRNKNIDELRAIVSDYKELDGRIKTLYDAVKTQRNKECKPHGFENQDLRFGGLIMRVKHCVERIEEYLCGEVYGIPELEEDILPCMPEVPQGKSVNHNHWLATALIKFAED